MRGRHVWYAGILVCLAPVLLLSLAAYGSEKGTTPTPTEAPSEPPLIPAGHEGRTDDVC